MLLRFALFLNELRNAIHVSQEYDVTSLIYEEHPELHADAQDERACTDDSYEWIVNVDNDIAEARLDTPTSTPANEPNTSPNPNLDPSPNPNPDPNPSPPPHNNHIPAPSSAHTDSDTPANSHSPADIFPTRRSSVINHITHLALKPNSAHTSLKVPVKNFSETETLMIEKGQQVVALEQLQPEEEIEIDVAGIMKAMTMTESTVEQATQMIEKLLNSRRGKPDKNERGNRRDSEGSTGVNRSDGQVSMRDCS